MSRKSREYKKLVDKMFETLQGKAELNENKGRYENTLTPRVSSKTRRHSGRVYPKIFGPQRVLDEDGVSVDCYYDDWVDYRDGFRDCSDRTKLRKKKGGYYLFDKEEVEDINKKIIKQTQIRKIRREIIK
jgi:hypothetical protein